MEIRCQDQDGDKTNNFESYIVFAELECALLEFVLRCQSMVLHYVETIVLLETAAFYPITHMYPQSHTAHSHASHTELGKQRDNIGVCTKVILPLSPHVPRDAVFFSFFSSPSPSSRSAFSNFIIFYWLLPLSVGNVKKQQRQNKFSSVFTRFS